MSGQKECGPSPDEIRERLAAAVGDERAAAACQAYEVARIAGLCHEGAWEVALGSVQPPRRRSGED